MQFIKDGPDVPERLLQKHEDGEVVFFCGAGISYPADLPGFGALVKKLNESLSLPPGNAQLQAIKSRQFDIAIKLIEDNYVGGRLGVRRAVSDILTPKLDRKNALSTHRALMELGQNRQGHMRLVTTNFDRLFEHLIEQEFKSVQSYQAPLLPIPKNRWDGLVYLHGLLDTDQKPNELERLVLSSGDFGLAYLTERWAVEFPQKSGHAPSV